MACDIPADILAIIPARGGSKGIPNKALVPLAGKPLIAHTIAAALAAESIARVVVSTEDDRIAQVARTCGAEVPFQRPAELATDTASGIAVFVDAIQRMRALGFAGDYAMLLQPTSPLRTTADIDAAAALMQARDAEVVVSVTPAEPHPWLAMQTDAEGWLAPACFQGSAQPGRQAFPPMLALNGAIYLVRIDTFLDRQTMTSPRTAAYVMDRRRSVDIDEPFDLELCEWLMSRAD